MKICFVHVADFFFHKEAYNSIAVGIFLLLFFTDISLQNDYLVENNGFLASSRESRGSGSNWGERVVSFQLA